jgi:hypothetical protein
MEALEYRLLADAELHVLQNRAYEPCETQMTRSANETATIRGSACHI